VKLLLALTVVLTAGWGPRLPQYVAGPLSGFELECKEAGQKAPEIASEIGDLDGDGQPDHLLDTNKGCAAVKALYCNAEGCVIDVFLSSFSGNAGGFHAKRARVIKGKPAVLELTADGPACGKPAGQDCVSGLVWNGEEFKPRE
jgi:hypothetical protein